eukprot:CAMPEP_0171109414 /NCGR_PEP_ID=MMETSP0766_2-20121228/70762_1 /TAXON_ID=439317 /ORGANISM="Gambierdiscus australes, Strain CAWD 149" /LENGTH=337 /DNA_ID=CAMNT_0011571147 /DNA_START=96 /DNA_END=1109 /DNA_ORIENTATION=+
MAVTFCRLLGALAIVADAGTLDELSLVQQPWHIGEPSTDLRPSAMPPEFLVIQRFPFMGRPTNISTDNLMTLVMEVLAAFRDEKLLQTVYASIENFTQLANTMLTVVSECAGNLSHSASERGDSTMAFIHLEEFLLLFDGTTETAVSKSMAILQTLLAAIPESSIVKQWTVAALDRAGLSNATKEEVEHLVAHTLLPQTKALTEPHRGFCQRLQPLMANLSAAGDKLSTHIIPGLAQMSNLVPTVVNLSKRFAPDVEDEVGKFANTTLATVTVLLNSGQIVLDKIVDSIKLIAEGHLDCGGGRRHRRRQSLSRAPRHTGSRVLAVAAAIVTWMAAAL